MNWIDIVISVCVLIGVIKGLIDGFITQITALLALAGGILFAGLLAKPIKDLFLLLPENSISTGIINGISYVLAFVIIMTVILLLGKAVNIVINFTPAVVINKLAGVLIGACIWLLSLSLILNIIATFDIHSSLITKETKQESHLYEPVKLLVPAIYPLLRGYFVTSTLIDEKNHSSETGNSFAI